jgi:hypothetical protein
MLSKCANPACDAHFLYLHEGKLFRTELEKEGNVAMIDSAMSSRKPVRRIEYFWLCGACSEDMTLVFDKKRGVVTRPLRLRRKAS